MNCKISKQYFEIKLRNLENLNYFSKLFPCVLPTRIDSCHVIQYEVIGAE